MRILFILVIVVAAAAATCDQTRIVSCMLQHMDTDQDGKISTDEFDSFVFHEPCGHDSFQGYSMYVYPFCDINKDGYLDATDYNESTGCVRVAAVRNQICTRCDKCDAMK